MSFFLSIWDADFLVYKEDISGHSFPWMMGISDSAILLSHSALMTLRHVPLTSAENTHIASQPSAPHPSQLTNRDPTCYSNPSYLSFPSPHGNLHSSSCLYVNHYHWHSKVNHYIAYSSSAHLLINSTKTDFASALYRLTRKLGTTKTKS